MSCWLIALLQKTSKRMKRKLPLTIFTILLAGTIFAQDATTTRKKHFNLDEGIAIEGYDPVAYFNNNKAVKGDKNFVVYHQGATYRFSSVENKEAFKKNPSAYEPQYGGWCAYAMGKNGEKVSVDPETFKILNGKLYLFYNKTFNNTLKSWNKNEAALKTSADANWTKIFQQ
jgi:YHS domain-containing protein